MSHYGPCEYCGPVCCYRGAGHNARVEDNARFDNAPTEGATMKDSHGQTAQCAHDYDKNVDFPKICNRCGFSPDGGWLQRTADNVRKEVATWPSNSSFPTTPTIVQDYREYTADEILHGIVNFAERSGWGDPANLGHWLGAAQRWDKEIGNGKHK